MSLHVVVLSNVWGLLRTPLIFGIKTQSIIFCSSWPMVDRPLQGLSLILSVNFTDVWCLYFSAIVSCKCWYQNYLHTHDRTICGSRMRVFNAWLIAMWHPAIPAPDLQQCWLNDPVVASLLWSYNMRIHRVAIDCLSEVLSFQGLILLVSRLISIFPNWFACGLWYCPPTCDLSPFVSITRPGV